MRILHKIWLIIKMLLIIIILAGLSIITPIFANVGVFVLNLFSTITLDDAPDPKSLVVLGGGLTKKDGEIVLNRYSQSRADIIISLYADHPLPIITSGTESPWLQEHIKISLPHAVIISDNASMNTCENAVFTAKLMHHHELDSSVHLITDRYHMARARRQFALMGIATRPQVAPLPIPLTWTGIRSNLTHSRRTAYEMVALMRDIFRPQNNCRNTEQITLEEISTPRRKPKVFSLSDENLYD